MRGGERAEKEDVFLAGGRWPVAVVRVWVGMEEGFFSLGRCLFCRIGRGTGMWRWRFCV